MWLKMMVLVRKMVIQAWCGTDSGDSVGDVGYVVVVVVDGNNGDEDGGGEEDDNRSGRGTDGVGDGDDGGDVGKDDGGGSVDVEDGGFLEDANTGNGGSTGGHADEIMVMWVKKMMVDDECR